MTNILFQNRLKGGIASVLVVFVLIIMFSSIGVLMCEQQDPGAKIKSAEDAIWWSVTTITTVGYGDLYPVTTEGRCLAMLLMLSGVGMFGTLSGIIASLMMGKSKIERDDRQEIIEMLNQINSKIEALRREGKNQ